MLFIKRGADVVGQRTLSDAQMGQLVAIIIAAFNPGTFGSFVNFKLEGRKITDFQGPNDTFPKVIENVVSKANEGDWIMLLLTKLRKERPDNSNLGHFCDQAGLPPREDSPDL